MKVAALLFFCFALAAFAEPTQDEWIAGARVEVQKVQAGADFAWSQMNSAYSKLGEAQITIGVKQGEINVVSKIAARVPELEKEVAEAKAAKAHWQMISIGLGVVLAAIVGWKVFL